MIVLSIDQASNVAGVSIWENGELLGTTELRSESRTDSFSRRLQYMVPQLDTFLSRYPPVDHILFEGVKARLVMVTVGAFLSCPRLDVKLHEKYTFVGSTSWKKWAKDRGATGPIKEIKGVKALKEAGFPVHKHNIESDDIADSIMIFKTWESRR